MSDFTTITFTFDAPNKNTRTGDGNAGGQDLATFLRGMNMPTAQEAERKVNQLLLEHLERDLKELESPEKRDTLAYKVLLLLHQTPEGLAEYYRKQIAYYKDLLLGRSSPRTESKPPRRRTRHTIRSKRLLARFAHYEKTRAKSLRETMAPPEFLMYTMGYVPDGIPASWDEMDAALERFGVRGPDYYVKHNVYGSDLTGMGTTMNFSAEIESERNNAKEGN